VLPPFNSSPPFSSPTPAIILTAKQTALTQDMMYAGLLAVLCPLDAKPPRHAIHKPVGGLMAGSGGTSILNASESSRGASADTALVQPTSVPDELLVSNRQ